MERSLIQKKSTTAKANLARTLDRLWQSIICRKPCIRCGQRASAGHHIIARRHKHYRWDLRNGVALCYNHHQRAHIDPIEFDNWLHENYPATWEWAQGPIKNEPMRPSRMKAIYDELRSI